MTGGAPPPTGAATEGDFRATWQEFCAAPRLLGPTPGVREQWAAGRPHYAIWAVRIDDAEVTRRIANLQARLTAWTRPVDLADLHVTAWVAGFPSENPSLDDDIDVVDLDRQADALRGQGSFRLMIGSANSFTTAPFLEVIDLDGGLSRLRQVLDACGPPELRFAPYRPHVTIGTATADHPVAPVRACLEAHRHLPPIEVEVRGVEQVRFDASRPGARLHTHRTVVLP